jgi:hypothetical protein
VPVFVSYAYGDAAHEERVRGLWLFLRAHGSDARLDLPGRSAGGLPVMDDGAVRDADQILMTAFAEGNSRA